MRVFRVYQFLIGTKIPFPKWFDIVHTFLKSQGLQYGDFLYEFSDMDFPDSYRGVLDGSRCQTCPAPYRCELCKAEALQWEQKRSACHRAVKDIPQLGPLVSRKHDNSNGWYYYLTNMGNESCGSEELILENVSRIYRKYGFSETVLCYSNIDFFSRSSPTEIIDSRMYLHEAVGAGIVLHRSMIGTRWNGITLCVETCFDGVIYDPTPYAEAMAALLPGIKRMEHTFCHMTQEEQKFYRQKKESVKDLVANAQAFFQARFSEKYESHNSEKTVSVGTCLKRLCKEYGFTYIRYDYYTYFLQKRTAFGHYIGLEFDSGPRDSGYCPVVYLRGLGFNERIWCDNGEDRQGNTLSYLKAVFEVLREAEGTVLADLATHYPTTPDWYEFHK